MRMLSRFCSTLCSLALASVLAAEDDLSRLLTDAQAPKRFAEHQPQFRMERVTETFHGPAGPYQESFEVVRDGDRAIALRSNRPQLDLFTHDPALGFTEIPWPARYHNATIWGTRLTTIPFIGPWRPTGTEHRREWTVAGDGQSITLHEWQVWDGRGRDLQVPGRVDYRLTISCDPVLGYVVDLVAELDFAGPLHGRQGPINGLEFTNFLDGRMSSVWPHRQRYDYTIYTPGAGDMFAGQRFAGWASNTLAGDFSDAKERRRRIRPNGLIAFTDQTGWNPCLATIAPVPMSLMTCNVWQDQHNHLDLPAPADDNRVTMTWRARHAYLPPEATALLMQEATLDQFEGRRGVIIRIGTTETFDDQPIAFTEPVRGATNAYGMTLSGEQTRSGGQALLVNGAQNPEGRYAARGGFLSLPQIRLEPNTTYTVEAWVYLENDTLQASLTADTYEWTPHSDERIERIETNVVHGSGQWHHLQTTITNGPSDVYSDFRFRVVGDGRAWFDDVRFAPVDPNQQP